MVVVIFVSYTAVALNHRSVEYAANLPLHRERSLTTFDTMVGVTGYEIEASLG